MAFVKIVKNKPYFKRFQTKFRRRREFKTDYFARRRMVIQAKNKYETKKYRLVVRRTNYKIICQIVYSTIRGDRVLCQSSSAELKKFGLTAGLTNYSASYATGLLVARRLLKQLGMDDMYKGVTNVTGEYNDPYEAGGIDDNRRPFKAILDIGITRSTTGNRVFGAMKGASDGGVYIKHKNKRFPGYKCERTEKEKNEEFDAKEHRRHIFGQHVQDHMEKLKEESKDAYMKQYGKWDKCLKDNKTENLEELYSKVHKAIRAKPEFEKKKESKYTLKFTKKDKTIMEDSKKRKWKRDRRLTREQRKQRVDRKLAAAAKKLAAKK